MRRIQVRRGRARPCIDDQGCSPSRPRWALKTRGSVRLRSRDHRAADSPLIATIREVDFVKVFVRLAFESSFHRLLFPWQREDPRRVGAHLRAARDDATRLDLRRTACGNRDRPRRRRAVPVRGLRLRMRVGGALLDELLLPPARRTRRMGPFQRGQAAALGRSHASGASRRRVPPSRSSRLLQGAACAATGDVGARVSRNRGLACSPRIAAISAPSG